MHSAQHVLGYVKEENQYSSRQLIIIIQSYIITLIHLFRMHFFESENIDCNGNDSLIIVVILSTTYISCLTSRLLVYVRKLLKNTSKLLLIFDFVIFANGWRLHIRMFSYCCCSLFFSIQHLNCTTRNYIRAACVC